MTNPTFRILRVDGSARRTGSVTRALADRVVEGLLAAHPGAQVTRRDLAGGVPLVSEDWIGATFTAPGERTGAQREVLAASDAMVDELRLADAVVLAVPIYNFTVPAAFKAWLDQVCRAGETFRYGAAGPQGLLPDRPVYLVMASGGVPLGSAADFASAYLRHVLGFIGLRDLRLIAAEGLVADPDAAMAAAQRQLTSALAQVRAA